MREIKFKCWDSRNKKMGIANEVFTERGAERLYNQISKPDRPTHYAFPLLEDLTFLQFTGLKDKNGVEIYEGDIVKACSEGVWCNGVITWGMAGFFIKIPPPQSIWYLSKGHDGKDIHAEVIGNIYQNPELLK